MTYKHILKASASILLLGSVAACGNNNVDDPIVGGTPTPAPAPSPTPTPTPTPTPSTASTFQDRFGAAFAAIFNRPSTADPVIPQPGDVPPLAPASDPLVPSTS